VSDGAGLPGPCLGVDLGAVRIGLAVTDSARTVAIPRGVLARRGDEGADHDAIAELARELGATVVVVGVPLSLDGGIGPAAGRVIAEAARLAAALSVPVATIDERFSTVEANRRQQEADRSGRRGGAVRGRVARRRALPGRRVRLPVDAGAAAVILQAYIDRARQQ
jgi:putative Holliday junction resolvase